MANVRKRRVVVVHPRADESSVSGTGATGKVDNLDAKSGGEGVAIPERLADRIWLGRVRFPV